MKRGLNFYLKCSIMENMLSYLGMIISYAN
jgi:hypothetical protein